MALEAAQQILRHARAAAREGRRTANRLRIDAERMKEESNERIARTQARVEEAAQPIRPLKSTSR